MMLSGEDVSRGYPLLSEIVHQGYAFSCDAYSKIIVIEIPIRGHA